MEMLPIDGCGHGLLCLLLSSGRSWHRSRRVGRFFVPNPPPNSKVYYNKDHYFETNEYGAVIDNTFEPVNVTKPRKRRLQR